MTVTIARSVTRKDGEAAAGAREGEPGIAFARLWEEGRLDVSGGEKGWEIWEGGRGRGGFRARSSVRWLETDPQPRCAATRRGEQWGRLEWGHRRKSGAPGLGGMTAAGISSAGDRWSRG